MKTEVLLRSYTPWGKKYLQPVADLIRSNTSLSVTLIDDTEISLEAFHPQEGEALITIDRHLAKRFNIPYYQISRVFNYDGDVISRITKGEVTTRGNHVRILDTDMVNGDAIRLACAIFGTETFSVPLAIKAHQELIDIEDLSSMILDKDIKRGDNYVSYSSILSRPHYGDTITIQGVTYVHGENFHDDCYYLENSKFFMNRTSLPFELYNPLCDLFEVMPTWRIKQ